MKGHGWNCYLEMGNFSWGPIGCNNIVSRILARRSIKFLTNACHQDQTLWDPRQCLTVDTELFVRQKSTSSRWRPVILSCRCPLLPLVSLKEPSLAPCSFFTLTTCWVKSAPRLAYLLMTVSVSCISRYQVLQLYRVQQWERDWQMSFNPSKCEVVRVTKRRNPVDARYHIHDHGLTICKTGKYLGVVISEDPSWMPHVDTTIKKANNSLAFLRRNLTNCPQDVKAQCYKTLVRPILEYATAAWDPYTNLCIQ